MESFRRQSYPNKELLILNDCGAQLLKCRVPGVRVINVGTRYRTLGGKFNALVTFGSGTLLMPWEDDDISLPYRIEQAVERIGRGHYWNPQGSWYLDDKGMHKDHTHGVCHNASIFSAAAWIVAGRYPETSGNQDAEMDRRLRDLPGRIGCPTRDPAEWQYVYRWGVSDCHLSGNHHHQRFWNEWGQRPVESGVFEIEPRWHRNYEEMRNEAL